MAVAILDVADVKRSRMLLPEKKICYKWLKINLVKNEKLGVLTTSPARACGIPLPGDHGSHPAGIGSPSHHAQVTNLDLTTLIHEKSNLKSTCLELDDVQHLVGGQIQLNAIIHLHF